MCGRAGFARKSGSVSFHFDRVFCQNEIGPALCPTFATYYSAVAVAWLFLIVGGLFEVAFALCLGKAKETPGPAWGWYAGFALCATASFLLLNKSLQHIPVGTAYAVWTGIGAVGTAVLGMLLFNDPPTFWRLFFLATLVGSVAGLKFVSH